MYIQKIGWTTSAAAKGKELFGNLLNEIDYQYLPETTQKELENRIEEIWSVLGWNILMGQLTIQKRLDKVKEAIIAASKSSVENLDEEVCKLRTTISKLEQHIVDGKTDIECDDICKYFNFECSIEKSIRLDERRHIVDAYKASPLYRKTMANYRTLDFYEAAFVAECTYAKKWRSITAFEIHDETLDETLEENFYIVAEASWTIHKDQLEEVCRIADSLRVFTGKNVHPVASVINSIARLRNAGADENLIKELETFIEEKGIHVHELLSPYETPSKSPRGAFRLI